MKKDIHPIYDYVVFHDNSADRSFLTKSTLAAKAASLPSIVWEDGRTYPLVNVEVSSYSHPFYTGKSMVLDTAGQVQKFNARYGRTTARRSATRTRTGNEEQA
jgi:large subunit ribosomal protein L31